MNERTLRALDYLARGWSIFPCEPGGKAPLIDWKDYQSKPPTKEQVAEWWRIWPEANIAVATGKVSGLVVVDVDTYKGGSNEGLPFTRSKASTARGGEHYFYRYPPGIAKVSNQVGKDGRDVRADGGYIILAPSTTKDGSYKWEDEGPLGIAPKWAIRKEVTKAEKEDGATWLSEVFSTGLKEGSRNDTVARLAGYLYKKRIPLDVAMAMVRKANETSDKPLEDRELRQTVESTYRTAKERGDDSEENEREEEFRVVPMAEYMRKHGGYVAQWLVEDWIPDRTIAFVVAPPEHYKTWLLFDLAVSIATGTPFMGKPVERTGPVVLVQQEDFPGQTTQRLEAILAAKLGHVVTQAAKDGFHVELPALSDIPIYLPDDEGALLRFDSPACMEKLEEIIREIEPVLVSVDPLYSAVPQDNYMADAVKDLLKLKTLRNRYGCSFMLAHHTAKRADNSREGLWGSQFLNALLETGWQIRATKEGTRGKVKLMRHFKSAGAPPTLQVNFSIDTTTETYYYETEELAILTPDELKTAMIRQLEDTGEIDISRYETEDENGIAVLATGIANELGLQRKGLKYVKH